MIINHKLSMQIGAKRACNVRTSQLSFFRFCMPPLLVGRACACHFAGLINCAVSDLLLLLLLDPLLLAAAAAAAAAAAVGFFWLLSYRVTPQEEEEEEKAKIKALVLYIVHTHTSSWNKKVKLLSSQRGRERERRILKGGREGKGREGKKGRKESLCSTFRCCFPLPEEERKMWEINVYVCV